jgi:hypothetical protein
MICHKIILVKNHIIIKLKVLTNVYKYIKLLWKKLLLYSILLLNKSKLKSEIYLLLNWNIKICKKIRYLFLKICIKKNSKLKPCKRHKPEKEVIINKKISHIVYWNNYNRIQIKKKKK